MRAKGRIERKHTERKAGNGSHADSCGFRQNREGNHLGRNYGVPKQVGGRRSDSGIHHRSTCTTRFKGKSWRKSKEQHALGNGSHTAIPIKAERDGIVLDVQQQAGSYVTEGAVLCSVAEAGSLVFEINVPYEQRRYAHSGSKCMLELPDGTRLTATVHAPLVTMNTVSQSERVIARAKAPFLPEGMNVKAVFTESGSSSDKGMILPKSAVQSDETLTEHWVMKLADDSTAVKVPVEVGNSNASEIEIKSTALLPQDRIILTGGYGLEDGAKVIVTKEEAAL